MEFPTSQANLKSELIRAAFVYTPRKYFVRPKFQESRAKSLLDAKRRRTHIQTPSNRLVSLESNNFHLYNLFQLIPSTFNSNHFN